MNNDFDSTEVENQKALRQNEQRMDELSRQATQAEKILDELEASGFKTFRQLREVDEELAYQGSRRAEYDLQEDHESSRYFHSLVDKQREEIKRALQEERRRLEEKQEKLQKKAGDK